MNMKIPSGGVIFTFLYVYEQNFSYGGGGFVGDEEKMTRDVTPPRISKHKKFQPHIHTFTHQLEPKDNSDGC